MYNLDISILENLPEINIAENVNQIFDELLQELYYPSPYRFDVIPTSLLSDIYEILRSKLRDNGTKS